MRQPSSGDVRRVEKWLQGFSMADRVSNIRTGLHEAGAAWLIEFLPESARNVFYTHGTLKLRTWIGVYNQYVNRANFHRGERDRYFESMEVNREEFEKL